MRTDFISVEYDEEKFTLERIVEITQRAIQTESLRECKTELDRFSDVWRDIGYGTLGDFMCRFEEKYERSMSEATARVYLSNLTKQGELVRVQRAVYKHFTCTKTPPSNYSSYGVDKVRNAWRGVGVGTISDVIRWLLENDKQRLTVDTISKATTSLIGRGDVERVSPGVFKWNEE